MRQYKYVCLFFLVSIFTSGCRELNKHINTPTLTPSNSLAPLDFNVGDSKFLSGVSCVDTCFIGIEPGKTSQAEVEVILNQNNLINSCKKIDYQDAVSKKQVRGLDCQFFSITYADSTKLVSYIRFAPAQPFSLQGFIDKYGFPDMVVVLDTGFTESPAVQASIYYSDLKIVLPLSEEKLGATYEIQPAILITVIGYLDTETLQRDIELFDDNIVLWKGYGDYP